MEAYSIYEPIHSLIFMLNYIFFLKNKVIQKRRKENDCKSSIKTIKKQFNEIAKYTFLQHLKQKFPKEMPRNIIIPEEEQQNSPQQSNSLQVRNKVTDKRSSTNSNMSDQDPLMESKWRTNLLITEDQQRVHKRDQGYRKNTSFENKIINDHIKVMIECICEIEENGQNHNCLKICNKISAQQAKCHQGIIKEKIQNLVTENTFLTEDEKQDVLKLFTQNYDNYEILLKTSSRLECLSLLKDELSFILFKIVEFISSKYQLKLRKYDEAFMEQQIPARLTQVVHSITCHPMIKLINPEYFYNQSQKKYMKIIQIWFYCVFAIKLGVYGNKYHKEEQNEEMEMEIEM